MSNQKTEEGGFMNNGEKGFDFSDMSRCTATLKTTGKKCRRPARMGLDLCGRHAGLYTPGAQEGYAREKIPELSKEDLNQIDTVLHLLNFCKETLRKIERR